MADFATALRHLREATDALAAADLATAGKALAAHDASLRAACEGATPPAASELEFLAANQRELLTSMLEVRERVSRALSDTRRSGAAVRAYLGSADG